MGNDVRTYILLTGNTEQINHFINHHKSKYSDMDIWDCKPFLLEKKCSEYLKNPDIDTGGRFREGVNSKGVPFIILEAKYTFIYTAIKLLSQYYNDLTIKLDFQDEDYELGIGILVIQNGDTLGEYYISISDIKDFEKEVINTIGIYGNGDFNNLFDDIKKKFHTHSININENILKFKSNEIPEYHKILEIFKKYNNLHIFYTYEGNTPNKFFGYIIKKNKYIIADEFINLDEEEHSSWGIIDYFKYNNFEDYKKNNVFEFLD